MSLQIAQAVGFADDGLECDKCNKHFTKFKPMVIYDGQNIHVDCFMDSFFKVVNDCNSGMFKELIILR